LREGRDGEELKGTEGIKSGTEMEREIECERRGVPESDRDCEPR